ncbi:MAG TPA: hypothetical protein PLS28_02225 [Clostridiales bacterium]|nr:hypothetical protein [Clostridiales bacterium]
MQLSLKKQQMTDNMIFGDGRMCRAERMWNDCYRKDCKTEK